MNIEVVNSIRMMIDYLDDERSDYEGHIDEGCDPKDHIYYHIQQVEEYLDEKLDRFFDIERNKE